MAPRAAVAISRAVRAAFSSRRSQPPAASATFSPSTFSWATSESRKFSCTNSVSAAPSWSFFRGIRAVCGTGTPIGWRNSAVTANQSASAPTMPPSAAART